MLPASWAALTFVLLSAWLWAARSPSWFPTAADATIMRHSAAAAASVAAALALTSIFAANRRIAMAMLLLAAAALAWARAPLPRMPPLKAEKIVELEGRLVRSGVSQFGGVWGVIDQVRSPAGEALLAHGQTMFFQSALNSLPASGGQFLRLRGPLTSSANGMSLRRCQVWAMAETGALSWLSQGRSWVRQRLQRNLPPPHRAMASALLLGEKGELETQQRQSYRRLGLLHLLAISGMHFWVWSGLLRRLLPRPTGWLRLPILFAFAALADFSDPVLRAFTAVLIRDWLAARGRGVAPFTLWSSAAWVELALAGDGETSLGFLLTYLATAALLWGRPPHRCGWWRRLLQPSTTAFLGTMPTLHALQGTIEPWSIPLTPVFALMIPPRLVASLLSISHALTSIGSWMMQSIHNLEIGLMAWAAALPAAPWVATQLPNQVLFLATVLAVAYFGPHAIGKRWWRAAWWAPMVGVLLWPWQPLASVVCLPVGHGLATAVIGAEKTLLFDLGSANDSPGQLVDRKLLPALNRLNSSLQMDLVLSHGDQDHTNAAGFLADRVPFVLREVAWKRKRMAKNRPRPAQGSGLEFTPSLEIPNLHPFRAKLSRCSAAGSGDSNDGGQVVDLRGPNGRAVLIGDSYGHNLRVLCRQIEAGPISLLLLPHHGLTTDGVSELLDHLKPRQAWASSAQAPTELPVYPLLEARSIPLWTTGYGALLWR